MQEIDLGEDVDFKVKYKGAEYVLREPTVLEIQAFQTTSEVDSVKAIDSLLQSLGLPANVIPGMGMSKARKLMESIVDIVAKKK